MEITLLAITVLLTILLIYPLFSWMISFVMPAPPVSENKANHFFACIIPVYNNLAMAEKCIQSLQNQSYKNFRIYVVVDGDVPVNRKSNTRQKVYLYPPTRLGSKHRSLHFALTHLNEEPDYVLIFDADNLVEPRYIETINRHATPEYKSIQGKRIAKNLDSVYACLDAANEYFYNVFFREVPMRFRSSALTSGSGVAVEYNLFKKFFDFFPVKSQMTGVIHGEDKFLQVFIVQEGSKIRYTTSCTVFDEKVAKGSEVSSQRSRWFISYFKCLPYNLRMIIEGLTEWNGTKLIFGLQASYPPVFMLLGAAVITAIVLIASNILFAAAVLAFGVLCLTISFPLFLIASRAPREVIMSLFAAPRFVFFQIVGFLRIRKAYNKTLVTQNRRVVSLQEVLNLKS